MEKEKTAVEWLNEQLKHTLTINQMNDVVIMDLFKEAKEMEKKQIMDAYDEGRNYGFKSNGEEYYNETFKSK